MEKGVKGFRFDVINLISKAGFEDDFSVDGDGRSFYTDGPRIHEFLQELANENDYKFDMTLSNFEKLLKKIN